MKLVRESLMLPCLDKDALSVLLAELLVTISMVTRSPMRQSRLGEYSEPADDDGNTDPPSDIGGIATLTGNAAGLTNVAGGAAIVWHPESRSMGRYFFMHPKLLEQGSSADYQ